LSTVFALKSNFNFDVIVIGGGAAGFMAAIQAAESSPECKVLILEKSSKLLSKVRISGGGRCNVTNAERDLKQFSKAYPRGEKFMFRLLHQFGPADTVDWFANRGVKLLAEADGRMFPSSNSSEEIRTCFPPILPIKFVPLTNRDFNQEMGGVLRITSIGKAINRVTFDALFAP
jgi:predicted Rossmann fold flavoprotein